MKKGEIIREMLDDPEARELEKLKDKFLLLLMIAYKECGDEFSKVDGLTWPNGQGVLISKSEQQIENSFASANAHRISHTPYYAEISHDKKRMKQIIEMVFVKLGYPAGLRNEARNFIEPPKKVDLLAKYRETRQENEETEQVGAGDTEEAV